MNDQAPITKLKTVYLQVQIGYPSNQKDQPIEPEYFIVSKMPDDLADTVSNMLKAGVPNKQVVETLTQARDDKSESATVHHVIYTSAVSIHDDTVEQARLQCCFTAIAEHDDHVTADDVRAWVSELNEQASVTLAQMSR